MKRGIAVLAVSLVLFPSVAFAQSVTQQTQRDALINQLIALLTLQIEILQAQLVEMQHTNARLMPDEPVVVADPTFDIRPEGSKFFVWSDVPANPKKVTVQVNGKDIPTSLTLRADLTRKSAEFVNGMKNLGGGKFELDISDVLEGDDRFSGEFEVLFPEDFESKLDYSLTYEDENATLTSNLHKDVSTRQTNDE